MRTGGIERLQKEARAFLLRSYRQDPVFFAEHALGHMTWGKQREILRSVRDNEKTAVRACHGSSKTYTAAQSTVWFLNNFEDSKVITTAPTNHQVEHLLWAEINKIYTSSRIELEGTCLVKRIRTDQPDHFAIGFSTDKPARAEGWHAPAILFIFDEAKGLPQWLWDSIQGLMTGGRCRWLVISTTDGVQVGENFYRIFEKGQSDWNRIHISADESPYCTGENFKYIDMPNVLRPDQFTRKELDPKEVVIQIAGPKYIDTCMKAWGQDSVLYLTKVKGEIADQGSDTIIKLSQVHRMIENWNDKKFDDAGQKEAGVDVARGGTDDTIFWKRKGLKIQGWKTITSKQLPPEEKLEHIADELEQFVEFDKKMSIKIDDTGVGGGLTDIMQRRGYKIVPVNFQETAIEKDKYPNAISEMWFETAKMIQDIACPEIERLKKELVNRKCLQLDNRGRRVVESKDKYKARGFPSPDMADGFLLCFYKKKAKRGPNIH